MLTVRELIRDLGVKVVSGDEGLDAQVRWVHISELEDPTPWLSGGELLLTTGLQLQDAAGEREYLERLAGYQLAGLGFGTGFNHATVPPALVDIAEKRGFPLFEVPYEVPFIALTEKAFTHIVNEHYAVLQRAISAHERLERIVLSERGLDGVAAALSSLIGGPALIFDARGDVLARRAFKRALPDRTVAAVAADLRERLVSGHRRSYAPGGFDSGTPARATRARSSSAAEMATSSSMPRWASTSPRASKISAGPPINDESAAATPSSPRSDSTMRSSRSWADSARWSTA